MRGMKISNIQKESEKMKIKKDINQCEDRKVQVLLQMGIKTFDKIRKSELVDSDYDELCEEIKSIDIDIYTKYMKLRRLEKENKKATCQCGYVALKNEKFCPQCGNNLVQEEKKFIVCDNCNEETEINSNYCSCCGSKISRENNIENKYIYIEEDDFEKNIISDKVVIDCVSVDDANNEIIEKIENTSKEINYIIENYKDLESDNEEKYIENKGREFLKNREQIKVKNHILEE